MLLLVSGKNLEQINFLISEQASQSLRIRIKGSGGLSMSSSRFAACRKSLRIDIYRGGIEFLNIFLNSVFIFHSLSK